MDHRQESHTPPESAKKRTNGRACVTCHERKVRCDILTHGLPCSSCQSRGEANCRVYENKKSRSRSSRLLKASYTPIQPHMLDSRPPTELLKTLPDRQLTRTSEDPPPTQANCRRSRRFSTRNDTASSTETRENDGSTSNLAEFIESEDVRVREISRSSRLYFIGTEFSNLHYLVRQRSKHVSGNVFHFGSLAMAKRRMSLPSEVLQMPPKRLADQLVEAYFRHINRGFPIVDEKEFMHSYNNQDSAPRLSLMLLNAVFLVGAHVLSPAKDDVRSLRGMFFRRTKMLFDSRQDEHREDYLQTALLLTWHCDSLEDVVANSWHWVGVAARTALGMGMHRDVRSSNLNALDKSQWVRWWWLLFQFDVVVSASYGRPQAIHLNESDVPDLNEDYFKDIPDSEAAFTIHHTRLCVIFSEAMSKRVSIRLPAAERLEATRHADRELAKFITELPAHLQLSLSEANIWQCCLHLSYNNFLILLHRPLPREDPNECQPSTASDLSICNDAVMEVTSIFESLRRNGILCHLWLPSIYVLFTAMVHIQRELGSANPVVAAKSQRMFDSLLLTLRELSHHWLYAQSLLRLFENRRIWEKKQGEEGHDSGGGWSTTKRSSVGYGDATGSSRFSVKDNNVQGLDQTQNNNDDAHDFGVGGVSSASQVQEQPPFNEWPHLIPELEDIDWENMMVPADIEIFLAGINHEFPF